MKESLAILTVVYNNYKILDEFFSSLNKQTDTDFKVFVADLSTQKQEYTYPGYVETYTAANKGYAYGVNEGLKKALKQEYEMYAVTNCDVIMDISLVENTKKSLQNNPDSLIGAKIYYAKGFEFHKDRYKQNELGNIIWYAGGRIDWNNMYTFHRGVDELDTGQYDMVEQTDFITGCYMAFTKKTQESVGFWDDSYFLYYEDTDFCQRAKLKGLKLMYDPSIVLWHKNAQSTEGSGSELHQKYQNKNRLKFGFKYAPLKTRLHLLKNLVFSP